MENSVEYVYKPNVLTEEEVFARYKHIIPLRYADVFHLVVGLSDRWICLQ